MSNRVSRAKSPAVKRSKQINDSIEFVAYHSAIRSWVLTYKPGWKARSGLHAVYGARECDVIADADPVPCDCSERCSAHDDDDRGDTDYDG